MTTIAQIRDVIYGYLQKTTTLEKAELTVGSMDLVLVALNNARKFAEMAHDWSFVEAECFVTTSSRTLSPSTDTVWDAVWTTATLVGTNTSVSVRAWRDWGLYFEGVRIPLNVNTKRGILTREMEMKSRANRNRYQGSTDTLIKPGRVEVVITGSRVKLVPAVSEATTLYFDCFTWMDDYTEESDTDFFIKHGAQYMLWASLCELNKLVKQWVPRQEGNLSEPTKERDIALEALIRHDKAVIDQFRRVRIR